MAGSKSFQFGGKFQPALPWTSFLISCGPESNWKAARNPPAFFPRRIFNCGLLRFTHRPFLYFSSLAPFLPSFVSLLVLLTVLFIPFFVVVVVVWFVAAVVVAVG